MTPRRLAPFAALLGVQFAFASLPVAGKWVLNEGVPPFALAGLRVFFAGLIFAALALATARERVPARDAARLAGLALLGVALNQLLFLTGLDRTTAVNANLLIATIPVFTLVAAVALRHERFNLARAVGVAVAFAGALALLRAERFRAGDDVALGNLLVLLNCLSYSLYLVLSRSLLQRYRSMTVVAWTFLWGGMLMVPLAVPDVAATPASVLLAAPMVAVMAWIVLVPSVAAYGLNTYALKRVRASTVGSFVFVQPLLGVALALALLPEERLDVRSALAGLLIIAGVLLVARTEASGPPKTGRPISRQEVPQARGRAQPQPQEDDSRGRGEEAP